MSHVSPIAIVGVSCRFPGQVSSLDSLWELLIQGQDGITQIPAQRWNLERFQHPDRAAPGKSCSFAAGVLDNIQDFDHEFFGITRKEAESLDPQQKLALELAWEALEDAQIQPSSISGSKSGVYIGASSMDMSQRSIEDPHAIDQYFMTGTALSVVSNRISYILNLQGPSLTLDTACSSSLVAIHHACQSLIHEELPLTLAGGVNILYSPLPYIGFSKAHMLSRDGSCKVFDAQGNGFVRSEGGGIVVLKTLEQALRDGNRIHALIARSAVNSDGRTAGLALPNQSSQQELLKQVYNLPQSELQKLAYVEAHGTGTAAGDPIEARSIGQVLGLARPSSQPLYIGSVKSNIGHLEPASGMAGLMKAILVLRHRQIPANLHLNTLNPAIDFQGLNLCPVRENTHLAPQDQEMLAGVNSFGFGGTNAHVLLQDFLSSQEQQASQSAAQQKELPPLFISARSESSLRSLARSYAGLLQDGDARSYQRIAYSAATGRDHLRYRLLAQADSPARLAEQLQDYAQGLDHSQQLLLTREAVGENVRTAFVFSGNGSQWPGMGSDLLQLDPEFSRAIDQVDSCLQPLQGWSVREVLQEDPQRQARLLQCTEAAQPLLFALQVGLVHSLQAKGLVPWAAFGHSVGEVAAAYTSQALSLEQACRVIYYRSHFQGQTKGLGKMAAVNLSPEQALELEELQSGAVQLAAINCPGSISLSGDLDALLRIQDRMQSQGIFFRLLDIDYPFHSRHMQGLESGLRSSLSGLNPTEGSLRFISTVSGQEIPGSTLDSDYWWQNISQPVSFSAAAQHLLKQGVRIFLELGPHSILQYYLNACIREENVSAVSLPSLKRDTPGRELLDQAWRKAYVCGWPLQMQSLFPAALQRTELPAYPWDRQHCSIQPSPESLRFLSGQASPHPFLGYQHKDAWLWESEVDTQSQPVLAHHSLAGQPVFPAAGYLETALAVAFELHDRQQQEIQNLTFVNFLYLSPAQPRLLRTTVEPEEGYLRIFSRSLMSQGAWRLHCTGRLAAKSGLLQQPSALDIQDPESFGIPVDIQGLYRWAQGIGLEYGPGFQSIQQAWVHKDQILVALDLEQDQLCSGVYLQPGLVDGAFQALLVVMAHSSGFSQHKLFLPTRINSVRLYKADRIAYAHTRLEKVSPRSVRAGLTLINSQGQVLAEMQGCRFVQFQIPERLQKRQSAYQLQALPVRHSQNSSPCRLPDPARVQNLLDPHLERTGQDLQRDIYYQEILPLSRAALLSILFEHLQGLCPDQNDFSLQELIDHNSLLPGFRPYLLFGLDFLARHNMASSHNCRWTLAEPQGLFAARDLWQAIIQDYPTYLQEAVLLGRLSLHLSQVLKGQIDLPDILGLEASGAVEHFYTNSLSSRLLLSTLQELLSTACQDSASCLRILEVGAGPGEYLARILPILPKNRFEYLATDPDQARVAQMRSHWESRPEVQVQRLDIEHLAPEDLDQLGSFDLLLANHSLHKSDDLEQALHNCHRLLRPGGMLVISEFQPQEIICATLGLDPGFWELSPDPETPAPRLQTPEQWLQALQKTCFEQLQTVQESQDIETDCFLLLARRPEQQDQPEDPLQQSPEQQTRLWLLLEDEQPSQLAEHLARESAAALQGMGYQILSIKAGEHNSWSRPRPQSLNPFSLREWQELLSYCSSLAPKLEIVNLLGFAPQQELSASGYRDLQRLRAGATTLLAQALQSQGLEARLWLLAAGAMPGADSTAGLRPGQASPWGLGRVMRNELSGLEVRMLDIQAQDPQQIPFQQLLLELIHPDQDQELILTRAGRYSPRLIPAAEPALAQQQEQASDSAWVLHCAAPGSLEELSWTQTPCPLPGPDQVLVQPLASGLNFRDVMYVLGYLPEDALDEGFSGPSLGLECSGQVLQVGENVRDLQVGDEVIVMSGACLSSRLNVNKQAVFPKPAQWSHTQAATIPVAFFTAYYAMIHLARLGPGERILIHGGAGGVGLAAIQTAKHIGAEVFATAGTREKRDFLRLLGVEQVFDSRSLSFEQQILEATQGQGVDAVLNCLAGEALNRSLALLRPFGRFMELGKKDILADSALRMHLLRQNISFFSIDVDQIMNFRPELGQEIFQNIIQLCEQGVFTPLPHSVYQCSAVAEAFRVMQKSKHIGKIVLSYQQWPSQALTQAAADLRLQTDSRGSYLITGGLGGMGLALARRLIQMGARHLILCSRSGANSQEKRTALQELRAQGAWVHCLQADVADMESLVQGLDQALEQGMPRLKGVAHLAAQLKDASIENQSLDSLEQVLAPKAQGAWNLHLYTRDLALDFFILFSSVTTVFGNPGQANYVAANAELEGLAAYRRSQGLPALCVAWGPIQDVGLLQRDPDTLQSLKRSTGIVELGSNQVLDFLERLLSGDQANWAVFAVDWHKLSRLPMLQTSFFAQIPELAGKSQEGQAEEQVQDLLRRLSPEQGLAYLQQQVSQELALILRTSADKIKVDVPLVEQGMDSLMGIELTMALEQRFDLDNQLAASMSRNLTVRQIAAALQQNMTQKGNAAQGLQMRQVMQQHGLELEQLRVEELLPSDQDNLRHS